MNSKPKVVEVDCGYREEYPSGEIRYYQGLSQQGWVYKDYKAFESGNGVCYLGEFDFDDEVGANKEFISSNEKDYQGNPYGHTRKSIEEICKEVGLDIECAYDIFDIVDWQSPYTLALEYVGDLD